MQHSDENKRSPRAEQKRTEILEAAWQVFSEQGFERASMNAVQERWGGSKATIYSYFSSKEELFKEVLTTRSLRLTARAFQVFEHPSGLAETLHAFSLEYLDYFLNSDLMEVNCLTIAEGKALGFGEDLYRRTFKKNWSKVSRFLESRLPAHRLMPGGARTAAMHLKGLLDGDLTIRRSWGVLDRIGKREISILADNAVTAFLRIYTDPDTL